MSRQSRRGGVSPPRRASNVLLKLPIAGGGVRTARPSAPCLHQYVRFCGGLRNRTPRGQIRTSASSGVIEWRMMKLSSVRSVGKSFWREWAAAGSSSLPRIAAWEHAGSDGFEACSSLDRLGRSELKRAALVPRTDAPSERSRSAMIVSICCCSCLRKRKNPKLSSIEEPRSRGSGRGASHRGRRALELILGS